MKTTTKTLFYKGYAVKEIKIPQIGKCNYFVEGGDHRIHAFDYKLDALNYVDSMTKTERPDAHKMTDDIFNSIVS